MLPAGVRIVVHVVREHRLQLSGVLVGDGHQHFAKRHSASQLAYPDLLRLGSLHADGLGTLQAAAGALNQQRAQVGIATTADGAKPRVPAAGALRRYQAEPRGQLPTVAKTG
jgi:hypothetical protein